MLPNIPTVNLGVIAVSRDCFIRSLSERRRAAVVKACATAGINVNEIKVTVENENDAVKAVEEEEEAEIKRLEELAELYAIISLMNDEYPEF